ncbi:MAG: hypothetical protein Q8O76_12415 [Chloroflexota bacterium]|nr:hypothetical protein [Chloroflexota bacterium]
MPRVNLGGKEFDAIEVKFRTLKEEWNEYDLDDGSTVKMKTIVAEILRLEGQYDNEGNPAYYIKSGNIVVAKSPDHLKKK